MADGDAAAYTEVLGADGSQAIQEHKCVGGNYYFTSKDCELVRS